MVQVLTECILEESFELIYEEERTRNTHGSKNSSLFVDGNTVYRVAKILNLLIVSSKETILKRPLQNF